VTNEALAALAEVSVRKGTTIAGVQRKLSVHLSDEGGGHRLTLVGHPTGFILKPQTPEYAQLPEIEHLTMTLAAEVGIKTVPHGLVVLADGTRAYITRRIDRELGDTRRVPMEDMCQLGGRLTEDKYKGSYEQVAKIVSRYSC
jgi:serine/threonine-protein kinase HipA